MVTQSLPIQLMNRVAVPPFDKFLIISTTLTSDGVKTIGVMNCQLCYTCLPRQITW